MQKVHADFHKRAQGSVIPIDQNVSISFSKKRRSDLKWFTLNQSTLNGSDLLATEDNNPTQVWDAYEYLDVSDRVISLGFERSIKYPHSVQSSIADISLNNYDEYFSYYTDGAASPIAENVLPNRPLRMSMGFKDTTNVPVFVGLTQGMPSYSDDLRASTLKWTAMDFLSDIADEGLRQVVKLRNVTTDVAIAAILEQYGMTPDQYNLAPGQNIIPFVLFDKDAKAGEALKKLVQAENGALWLDEQGIVRFETRSRILGKKPVMEFSKHNIIKIKSSRESGITNRVKITSDIREVQSLQPIYSIENENGYKSSSDEDKWRVPPAGSFEAWLSFNDPAWSVKGLELNGDKSSSWFTAIDLDGNRVSAYVSASGELFQNSYKVKFTNMNYKPISIDAFEMWGEPAKVVDTINYEAYDQDSRDKFGDMPLEISDNHFFGSYRNCDLFAMDVLRKRSNYAQNIEMDVKGDPSLQLGDVVKVDCGKYSGNYLIESIKVKISKGLMQTTLQGVKQELFEPFILNKSVLDGEHRLG